MGSPGAKFVISHTETAAWSANNNIFQQPLEAKLPILAEFQFVHRLRCMESEEPPEQLMCNLLVDFL